jgi:serine/threonine protein kinase
MSTANCAADDALIGSRIDGRYTLQRVLGQGGMGVVYEGVHDELGRAVAIKVLNAAWATDRTAVERFLREARTASSFSHSNIVDVSDLGRLADGRPYLVMPKISGVDLATLLAENGPQPAKRVAALLAGVASALDLVHAKGFVHRDIKPENLMYVVREDGSETVMLLDFGIAAAVMSSGPRLTRQGAIFGTPHYLPPEVCTGERCDARGDVYSLAAVAFELITGQLPFGAEDIMQLMAQKVSYDAPSLAAVSGTQFPPELEQVIANGLARDPRYRNPSASSFISALRAATHSAPVSWRTGVVRPNTRSAEHELPPQTPQPSGRPAWEVERAPTWPIDSSRPTAFDDEEPATAKHAYPPSRSGYAPRPVSSRYGDESSTVRPAAPGQNSRYPSEPSYPSRSGQVGHPSESSYPRSGHQSEPSYPSRSGQVGHPSESSYPRGEHQSEPSYPRGGHQSEPSYPSRSAPSGHPSEPSYPFRGGATPSQPARSQAMSPGSSLPVPNGTANPGVWAAHGRSPHTPFPPTHEQLDPRLRMDDDRRRTATITPKSSLLPVLVGVCAFAALGMGAVQLIMAKRSSPQTDARASTLSTPAANHAPTTPTTPSRPAVATPAPSTIEPQAKAPAPVEKPAPTVAPTLQPAAPVEEAPPSEAPAAPAPTVAAAPEVPAKPAAPAPAEKPEKAPRAERSRPAAVAAPAPTPPTIEPAAEAPPVAAAPSSVLSVTPITPPPEQPAPEPEPEVPAVDTAGASNFAKQSSGALLRGELTRAIDLARRATQADPGYAIAWRSLGLALERAGSADQAMAAYREYLQRAPSGPQADMVRQRMQSLSP